MNRLVVNIEATQLFKSTRITSTQGYKYRTTSGNYEVRKRVVNKWNNLPVYVNDSPFVNTFKSNLYKHWD